MDMDILEKVHIFSQISKSIWITANIEKKKRSKELIFLPIESTLPA